NFEARWGPLWHRFLLGGGAQALTAGKHVLKLELRPYLKTTVLKVGDLIAAGELTLSVTSPNLDEKLSAVQPVQPGGGWETSKEPYDEKTIRELNRYVAEKLYKDVTGIVVIRDGKLLIEEYFNGASRETLRNPRSVGKSFTSTVMGL